MKILPRLLAGPAARALQSAPVLVVTGPRQTGKSTLVRDPILGRRRKYLTLDDIELLGRAESEPDVLVSSAERVTLDEVQRSPGLLLAVKRAVDRDRRPGRFILTGSANLLLMQRIAETLAGRAVHLTLLPLTRRELRGLGCAGLWSELLAARDDEWLDRIEASHVEEEDWQRLALSGGYPVPAYHLDSTEARSLWFAGYTQTYLERDLRELTNVSSLVEFRRLMRAACLRLGNLVNQTDLARDVGSSQATVRRHLDLLDVSHQLARVPAYSVNRTKRLIKTPKIYWTDTGLALHLAGEKKPRGAHLENLVLCDLLAWTASMPDPPQVLYWRTSTGEEVDFVVEHTSGLIPIEVKAARRARLSDAKSLITFRSEYPDLCRTALLLHAGTETEWLAEGVLAAPWWRVI